MSNGVSKQFPYRSLGFQLRNLREKKLESIADVSGAVEIEIDFLVNIENGAKLPSEDILLLLISHFGLKNKDAMKLWKLAGYDDLIDPNSTTENVPLLSQQSAVLLLPLDSRIVYTDLVQISANKYGIVMNFSQNSGQNNSQPVTVARVGMSYEHAESIITTLQQVLLKKDSLNKSNNNDSIKSTAKKKNTNKS